MKPKPPEIEGVWCDRHGIVRVMGMLEGYVVARRPGCGPGIWHWKDFVKRFKEGHVWE